mgnify:CR=1 FL=1
MNNHPIRLAVTAVTVATASALTLAACGGDVSADELREALVDQGMSTQLADCVVSDLDAKLDDDDFQTVATADEDFSGVSAELEAEVLETVQNCVVDS